MPILSRSPLSSFNPNIHRFPRSGAITISGVTLELSTPVARTVHLYDRVTGERVASTVSDAITGEYVFMLTNSTTVYFVVALDDNYGTAYQALISDRVSGNTTGGIADDSDGPPEP